MPSSARGGCLLDGHVLADDRHDGAAGPKVIVPRPSSLSLSEISAIERSEMLFTVFVVQVEMIITRLSVIAYAVLSRRLASTKNLPMIRYSPTTTNGMPQSLKNHGAFPVTAIVSQDMAKPPHSRLNGMSTASPGRTKIPFRGHPVHRSLSSGTSSCATRRSVS